MTSKKVLHKDHDLVVGESTEIILIGGSEVKYKRFSVPKSKEMEIYLNQQSIIKAAKPLIQQSVIDNTLAAIKNMFAGGGSTKKMIKNLSGPLMQLFLSPNPEYLFGGPCDPSVDKKICTGAVMSRIQTELPNVIPTLFMENFIDDDDDDDTSNNNSTSSGSSPLRLM